MAAEETPLVLYPLELGNVSGHCREANRLPVLDDELYVLPKPEFRAVLRDCRNLAIGSRDVLDKLAPIEARNSFARIGPDELEKMDARHLTLGIAHEA